MRSRPVRIILIVVGVIVLVIGAVWIGQGVGLIHGSAMTGDRTWLYIGILAAIVGVVVLILGLRPARGKVEPPKTGMTGPGPT